MGLFGGGLRPGFQVLGLRAAVKEIGDSGSRERRQGDRDTQLPPGFRRKRLPWPAAPPVCQQRSCKVSQNNSEKRKRQSGLASRPAGFSGRRHKMPPKIDQGPGANADTQGVAHGYFIGALRLKRILNRRDGKRKSQHLQEKPQFGGWVNRCGRAHGFTFRAFGRLAGESDAHVRAAPCVRASPLRCLGTIRKCRATPAPAPNPGAA